jgi:hypothetical protein
MKDIDNLIEDIRSSELEPNDDNDKKCAPGKVFSEGSCIELDVLIELVKAYNEENSASSIKLIPQLDTLNPKKYKKYLVKNLKENLSSICDDQSCWLRQDFVKRMKTEAQKQIKNKTFRPYGPQGKFTWLDTNNINNVMKQYEEAFPEFKFLGAVPIDFDDLDYLNINNLDFDDLLKKGKSKIGIVFNLDEHYKSGSHWVASYFDLKKQQIYFSDSYGYRPEQRIRKLLRRVARFNKNKYGGSEPDIKHNQKRHQYGNSECGVYSINFILRLLQGETFEDLTSKRLDDDKVNECRDVYFRKIKK